MCLVHLTLLAGARRQERPLPKLVKAFVNKRHQYFGLEPMHTSYEYSLSRIKQEPSKIGIKGTFNLFTASHWCTYSVLQLGHFGFAPGTNLPPQGQSGRVAAIRSKSSWLISFSYSNAWSCSLWITFEQVSQKKCGQLSLMPLDCQAGVSFPHFGFGHFILPIHGAFAS